MEFGRPRSSAAIPRELTRQWNRWVRACRDLRLFETDWLAAGRRDSRLRGEALLAMISDLQVSKRARARAATLGRNMIASKTPQIRCPAAAALWMLNLPGGRQRFLADLASSKWPERYAACRAARLVPRPEVLRALVDLLGDGSEVIRAAAIQVLKIHLPGNNPDFDPEAPPSQRARARALWTKHIKFHNMKTRREQERVGGNNK